MQTGAGSRMRFGVFIAPFHPAGVNPTLLLEEDLRLVEYLDRLGYDEAWFGEHHSGGSEIISSPELMIAAAIGRTHTIKLGTGVTTAPYHNPLWIAERAVQLDHMSRGRFILGLGPGALPSDASMVGIAQSETRDLLADAVEIITQLMRSGGPVTFKNDRWTLNDAYLHLRPYTDPHPEIVITAVVSPSGPTLAARYGHGLISPGATTAAGFEALGKHWDVMEERAAHFGTSVSRSAWRQVGLMHIAETREQAFADVTHGMEDYFDYNLRTNPSAISGVAPAGGALPSVPQLINAINESGLGTIGTPDDAIGQIERLQAKSGGFGTFLHMGTDWAAPEAKYRSYELFARHVAPRFQGQQDSTFASRDRLRAVRPQLLEESNAAKSAATQRYQEQVRRGE